MERSSIRRVAARSKYLLSRPVKMSKCLESHFSVGSTVTIMAVGSYKKNRQFLYRIGEAASAMMANSIKRILI